jgi:hypothetical protein
MTNPISRQMVGTITILAFFDMGEFRLAIRNRPVPVNTRAQSANGQAEEIVNSPNVSRPKKRAAMKQPSPMIILRARI